MSSSLSVTQSYTLRDEFTLADMRRFAAEAWGELGVNTVKSWAYFNERYFGGVLRPIPIVITPTLPYGRRLADCGGRLIRVNVPKDHNRLVADNNTLLHEMIHQYLGERGENTGHDSEGWRREIMRLTKEITGKEIWAGRSKTVRREKQIVRVNEPHADGRQSLPQKQIARWPHDGLGIDLGSLGSDT